jgi:lipopolysaccharide transport system ATP-binding protein
MSDIAIRVEGLSKAYRIGLKEQQHETMLGAMAAWVKSPFRNFRDVRMLSKFDDVFADARNQKSEIRNQKSANRPSDAPFQLSAFNSQLSSPSDVIWALRDVSFEVKHGEAVGIIGRNGAGKSTLLKILARITEPTSGRATIYGRVGSLLEVGTGFHPDLTGRENVYLNGTVLGMKKREIDAKFDEIVDFSGVEKFIDTPVKRYSSGMRIRLAFSVAAHLEPEILIVDEVLAVGDMEFQAKCLGKMQDVAGAGRTVLFVSHNMGAIQALCSSAAVLESGRLVYLGTTSAAVASYLGQTPVCEWINQIHESDEKPISIHRFRVFQNETTSTDYMEAGKPLKVSIDYTVRKPLTNLLLGLDVLASDGIHVFRSYDLQTVGLAVRQPGSYRSVLTLPSLVFREQTYFFELIAGIHRTAGWISRGKVRLRVSFEGPRETDVDYLGLVRPPGEWHVTRL